ncbi:isatin hydrolase-like [Daktulosphaira vitifoliae]|uniref:isatin hydrolase-like n=1 Tax=Daktulosphaira vitifoliae TaxID=58002 RepID=UPI0021AA159D|nr:isatin hydrolase-like [Daktulosphaira vitifoliae]
MESIFVFLFSFVLVFIAKESSSVVLDLSHGYRHNITNCWEPNEFFNIFDVIEEGNHEDGTWYTTEKFSLSEHCGTHIDAPYHFNKKGWKLGDIPLERQIVEGVHINVSQEVNGNADFVLTAHHLIEWEKTYGLIPNRSVILINFGWSHNFGNRLKYYSSENSNMRFPGLSSEAAQWIIDTGRVYGVGVDCPSVDPGNSKTLSFHRIISKANIYNLENVALNGTSLPPKGFKLIIQPIKLLDGTGGPCRILAITDNNFE